MHPSKQITIQMYSIHSKLSMLYTKHVCLSIHSFFFHFSFYCCFHLTNIERTTLTIIKETKQNKTIQGVTFLNISVLISQILVSITV